MKLFEKSYVTRSAYTKPIFLPEDSCETDFFLSSNIGQKCQNIGSQTSSTFGALNFKSN